MTPNTELSLLLQSGNYFDLINPRRCDIEIEDIAHALAHTCRFGGHTRKFYSVAQHSVLVSKHLYQMSLEKNTFEDTGGVTRRGLCLSGLLHDAAEAFIGDIPAPLKRLLPDYQQIEQRVEQAIFPVFGMLYPLPAAVKHADLRLLATERRDLMPEHDEAWECLRGIEPLPDSIDPWIPQVAFVRFMERYEELGGVL
ncbi:hypothetical protein OYT1_ch1621 [Ferriphaselus amnicola]|uniref:Metal dependent phosphohydrolase n=1 Tax=Ferriphaselus amnicola TaxID=1188319 RepID=A0A2Z6GCD3_9PROT|nr:YfbR-like 5'-deoxynucleotidase [Ferriphaselus amnicola]BBE51168.1 hypothetical protein OYT1_ch1621 [Ferriphaselus amnicola]